METVILYKYQREDRGITVSPIRPECEYTEMYRLIAGEGKELTNDGVSRHICIDVPNAGGWYEIDAMGV